MDRENLEKAVSPVIGVILLIVVVVILVAIVGSLALGIVGDVGENAQAGVSFSQNSISGSSNSTVDVTLTSLENADAIHLRTTNSSSVEIGLCGNVWTSQSDVGSVIKLGDGAPPNGGCEPTNGNGFANGSIISIVGELGGQNTTVTTYTVK